MEHFVTWMETLEQPRRAEVWSLFCVLCGAVTQRKSSTASGMAALRLAAAEANSLLAKNGLPPLADLSLSDSELVQALAAQVEQLRFRPRRPD